MAGFGGAVKLTGESQYKAALSSISRNLREVGSEMKVVSSAYDKNDKSTAAISAKTDVLNRKLEQQKSRLSTLQAQYKSYSATMEQNGAKHQALAQKYESEKAKLTAIGNSLGKTSSEYKKQQQVVDGLSQELQKSSQNQERNANTMSKLRVQMNNAQADVNKTSREIKELGDSSKETEPKVNKLKGAMSKVGGAMKTVAKVGAAALGAMAAGAGVIGKQSLEAYAKYEQMVGGVDTLFKKSSGVVQKYAANAYKTAGMSANDYMETVTGFSASLIQSLNGDTAKAAEVANRAITDMSDNANKMGTDMASIQYAYQGFAKQNYTMLDNLKLGYGGTKTEMQRLIKDASQMTDVQKRLGITVDGSSMSFANVVNAISVMQNSLDISGYSADELNKKLKDCSLTQEEVKKVADDMGISYQEAMQKMKDGSLTVKDANILLGTTAREAATTIEGSVNSMKAAWQNLLVGMADDTADFPQLMSNFTDSLTTMFQNVLPRIKVIIEGIGNMVESMTKTVLPQIMKDLPDTLNSLLPTLITAVTNVITSLSQALPTLVPVIIDALSVLANSVATALPQMFEAVVQAVIALLQQLADATNNPDSSQKFITGFIDMVQQIVDTLAQNAPLLIDAGIQLMVNLTAGLVQSLPTLIQRIPDIVSQLANIINQNAPKLIEAGVEIIVMLAKGLVQAIPTLISNIPQIIKAIWDVFLAIQWLSLGKSIITGLGNGIKAMAGNIKTAAGNVGKNIINALKNLPANLLKLGKNALSKLAGAIKGAGGSAKTAAANIFKLIINALKALPSKLLSLGKDAISKLASGIASMARNAASKASEIAKSVPDKLREMVTGASDIGKNVVKGIIAGITGAAGSLFTSLKNLASNALKAAKDKLKIHSPSKVFQEQVGKNIVLGIKKGITEQEKALYSYVGTFANGILGAFDSVPSSQNVGDTYAKSFAEGIKNSISDTQKGVTKSIRVYFENLQNANEKAQSNLKSKYDKQQKKTEKKYAKQIDTLEKKIRKTSNKNAKKRLQNQLSNLKKEYSSVKKKQKDNYTKQLNALKKQNEDIKSIYQNFGKVVGDQFNSALESATNGITDELTEKVNSLTDSMQTQIDAVQSKIDSMYSKLSGYGVMYNTKTDKKSGLEYIELTDITRQTEILQDYYDNKLQLKGRVSNDLIDAIAEMSVDDALKYTNQLLNMTESQLNAYDKAYTEKLNLSNKISEDVYGDRIETIKDKFTPQIKQAFADAKTAMKNVGKQVMQGLIDGMNEQEWTDEIKKVAKNITKTMKKQLGIKSPSTVFRDEVGKYVAQGFGIGFSDEMKNVSVDMAAAVPKNFSISPVVSGTEISGGMNTDMNLVESFKTALKQLKIELDDEVAGKFVERTVSNVIYR